jgi:lipopolysaccharide export LptBFGC system permease protein LptF
MTRPGTRLRAFAARLLDPATMERLIDPAIADLQHEHDDAIRRGHVWRGQCIRVAGYAAFWKLAMIAATRDALLDRTADDDRAVGRTVVFSLVAVLALTALLMSPNFSHFGRFGTDTTIRLVLYLVPQALAIALPLGLVFGVILGLRNRASTPHVKWTIVLLGLGCSVAAFVIVGWLMPEANQAFRELIAGRRVLRGLNELTLSQLARRDPGWLAGGDFTSRRLSFEFHFRVALAFASLALALCSLGLATNLERKKRGMLTTGLAGLAISFAYYALLYGARRAESVGVWLPPIVLGWLPNLVVLAAALLLMRRPLASRTQEFSR